MASGFRDKSHAQNEQKPLTVDNNQEGDQAPQMPAEPKDRKTPQGLNKLLNAMRGIYDEAADGFRDAKTRLGEEDKKSSPDSPPQTPAHIPPPAREYRPEPKGLHRQAQPPAPEADPVPLELTGSPALRPMQTKETGFRYRDVLVIGGMDFIGAALVHQLNLGGVEEIVVADSVDAATSRALPFLKFQEFLGPEELQEMAATKFRGLPSFSHIFHIGGWSTANLALAKNLYGTALKGGARFISLSSASSIGKQPETVLPDARNLPSSFRPQNQDGIVSMLFDRYALPKSVNKSYLSLKHYRLFGPGERPDDGIYGLIKSCYEQICATRSVRLPSALQPGTPEGDRRHDFFYVLEAARLTALLAQSPQASGVYELGSGNSCTAASLAETVFAVLGVPPVITWDDSLPFTSPSAEPETAHLQRTLELGWPLSQTLTEGVRHYIATYLQAGWGIGEDIELPESSTVLAAENKTPILQPRKKVRVANPM